MNEKLQFLRQRIEHEDNLINQRLSWLVGSQSFLITAFAISLNAPATTSFYNIGYAVPHERLVHLLPVISIVSIVVLMITLCGAASALAALRKHSDRITTAEDIPIHSSTLVRLMGLSAAFVIPLLFLGLWIVLWLSLPAPRV